MSRPDGRNAGDLRPVKIIPDYLKHPQGSALIRAQGSLQGLRLEDRKLPIIKERIRLIVGTDMEREPESL